MIQRSASLALVVAISACATPPPVVAPVSAPPPPAALPAPSPSASPPSTPAPTPEQALTRLFSSAKASEAWFGPAFLAKVPVTKIDAITASIKAAGGELASVSGKGRRFTVMFARAKLQATVELDDQGRFTSLFVNAPEPLRATVEEAIVAFRALPGKVSVVITEDGADRGSLEPDLPLGAGSSFKLAILAALRGQIEAKKRSWKDVVELDPSRRSLPSGFLQRWPDRAPMTLYALAALMISISDNTATDVLLGVVGRGPTEALAPRNKPLLATGEMFKLKGPGGAEALAAFQKGNEAERRKVLEALAKKPLPDVEAYPTVPTALDVEWFFSAHELCALMKRVHDLPLIRINPGPAKKEDWDSVAYKGGSEPGVLSMTTWVTKGARQHCVSATWNAPQELAEASFHAAYAKALTALKR